MTIHQMRHKLLFVAIPILAFLASCSGPDLFRGSYSYRTSGCIYFRGITVVDEEETGQLTIAKNGGDSVLLMFRPIVGEIYYLRGTAKGDSLFLNTKSKHLQVPIKETTYHLEYEAVGKGKMTDGTLLIKRKCKGSVYDSNGTMLGKISSDEILTMGTRNKD